MKLPVLAIVLILFLESSYSQSGWLSRSGVTSLDLHCLDFSDIRNGTAVGQFGTILRTTDGGETWVDQTNVFEGLLGVSFTDSLTGTIVGNAGLILRTTDAGTNWIEQESGVETNLLFVHFVNSNTGTAVGAGGLILHTTNGGDTWVGQTSGVINDLLGVHFLNEQIGTVVGVSEILRTTDGGGTWEVQPNPSSILYGVWLLDENTGVIVGDFGNILRTTDAGMTWEEQASPTAAWLYTLAFADANTGWAAGNSGTIIRTTDGGITWEEQDTPTNTSVRGIAFPDVNTGTAVGLNGTVLYTTTGGGTTSVDPSDETLPSRAQLHQNYPNPFNPSTTVRFDLPGSSNVSLSILDLLGNEVATLASGRREAGAHSVQWDATGHPSGVYFYRLETGEFVETKKLLLLK